MMVTGLAAILLALALLLVLVSLIQPLARRFEVSETVLLALAGILVGGLAAFVLRSSATEMFDGAAETLLDFPINSEAFLLIFLPVLVFQGALAIDVRRLAHEVATVLLLAVVAVVVSTAMIGLALYPVSGQSLVVCLLLGSIVATTDPSAVAGIFREIGAATRLTRLVEGEALLNDAAAIAIFSILLAAVTSHHQIHLGDAILDFVLSFGGAMIVGVALGRLALLISAGVGGSQAAEVTLTLALPYIVYILCDELLGFSGVVATAAAGLTVSAYGPSTFRPQVWRFLNELWEQLVFWAGSLVFLLASMLVPRLLIGMTRWDCVLIVIASVAGLLARGGVVFGMLPLLAATKISPPVPTPFKITMVWGGLRGAITLALALAVTENQRVSTQVAHFIGIIATGFVLVTLLLNGTTLRYLVLFLKLDQLSPIDQAMRHQILGIGLGQVAERTHALSDELGFSAATQKTIIGHIEHRAQEEREANTFDTALGDRQRVTLALITIANRERSLLLDLFRIQGLSRRVMETLLRTAEGMVDGARLEGRFGYVRALRRRLRPTLRFRLAQMLHHRLHIDQPLMYCMMERFEMLIIAHLVSLSLMRFMHERLEPTLGTRISEIVSEVLGRQRRMLDDALETLRLHYHGYSEALESRILHQIALRLEGEEYDTLLTENLISEELHRELYRDVERRRRRLETPLRFDLKSGIEQRLRAFPAFRSVPDAVLHDLTKSISLHFASPGEVLLKRGRKIRTIYAIVAGLAEVHVAEQDIQFGAGDLIGASAMMNGVPARGTVRSLQFGHLLAIPAARFQQLLKDYPIVQRTIDERAAERRDGQLSAVLLAGSAQAGSGDWRKASQEGIELAVDRPQIPRKGSG
ncbi:Na+/H+ antiporter [Neoasaia chiangmaiensis NBRC 101099]|uniref:Sodium:proton antiporter n=1 Tax=Neoasaia chiangmaiensis TaxID=320497 RepID=A0A1U9KMQ6_9PROT|nr:cation:proton antiporter [Neoasaia chiangmaiensis]AQS87048.1 sodium:proton antiporter [Neoasaia chiangmaiensis]GBR37921.1 Na+/H+ antiporter [Neoasaia chiangmaiensis NBRC 101099]GEN15187.1 sodium:proton antiporter [Neoasaia chiangmaiensis]